MRSKQPRAAPADVQAGLTDELELLHQLGEAMEAARRAVLACDLASFETQTVRQQEICQGLRELAAHEQEVGRGIARYEVVDARLRILQMNRGHAALLRRARRTADIFCRLLARDEHSYAGPGAACGFEVRGGK